jgi:serine/threonine-protein kinase SRK2
MRHKCNTQVFLTENYLGIAMEYANGGDSFEYVRKKGGLHENEARWFFQQLIVALDYCHRKGVINRDVKLENTLIHWARKPLLKICDFGYSKDMKYQSAPASRVGTPAYLAPEVCCLYLAFLEFHIFSSALSAIRQP